MGTEINTTTIYVWPDYSWCQKSDYTFYDWKSDDYVIVECPDELLEDEDDTKLYEFIQKIADGLIGTGTTSSSDKVASFSKLDLFDLHRKLEKIQEQERISLRKTFNLPENFMMIIHTGHQYLFRPMLQLFGEDRIKFSTIIDKEKPVIIIDMDKCGSNFKDIYCKHEYEAVPNAFIINKAICKKCGDCVTEL